MKPTTPHTQETERKSYWWIRFIHPDEEKTRVNPEGIRVRLIQVGEWSPLESDLDALREREGQNIHIVEMQRWDRVKF